MFLLAHDRVLPARSLMDRMATDACRTVFARHGDIANDLAIGRRQCLDRLVGEIDDNISKEVANGDKASVPTPRARLILPLDARRINRLLLR